MNKIYLGKDFELKENFYIKEIENNVCFFYFGTNHPFWVVPPLMI